MTHFQKSSQLKSSNEKEKNNNNTTKKSINSESTNAMASTSAQTPKIQKRSQEKEYAISETTLDQFLNSEATKIKRDEEQRRLLEKEFKPLQGKMNDIIRRTAAEDRDFKDIINDIILLKRDVETTKMKYEELEGRQDTRFQFLDNLGTLDPKRFIKELQIRVILTDKGVHKELIKKEFGQGKSMLEKLASDLSEHQTTMLLRCSKIMENNEFSMRTLKNEIEDTRFQVKTFGLKQAEEIKTVQNSLDILLRRPPGGGNTNPRIRFPETTKIFRTVEEKQPEKTTIPRIVGPPYLKTPEGINCIFCKEEHFSDACGKVIDVAQRKRIVQKTGRCIRCLKVKTERGHSEKCHLRICAYCKSHGIKETNHHRSLCRRAIIETSSSEKTASSMEKTKKRKDSRSIRDQEKYSPEPKRSREDSDSPDPGSQRRSRSQTRSPGIESDRSSPNPRSRSSSRSRSPSPQ